MKSITFCFDHPVAVKVFFECTSDPALKYGIKFLRSDENGSLTIPVDDIPGGSWKVMLEWNYEGRDFCMERKIEMPGAILS
jgi:hypothetical protein